MPCVEPYRSAPGRVHSGEFAITRRCRNGIHILTVKLLPPFSCDLFVGGERRLS
jgi:hypothetical protein